MAEGQHRTKFLTKLNAKESTTKVKGTVGLSRGNTGLTEYAGLELKENQRSSRAESTKR